MKLKKPLWAPVAWFIAFMIAIVVIVAEIIFNVTFGMFKVIAISLLGGAKHYFKLLEYFYKMMRPVAVCEICGINNEKVKLYACCNRWVHNACHVREAEIKKARALGGSELARMINADLN